MPNNAAMEYALATTPAPDAPRDDDFREPQPEALSLAADMARELNRRVLQAAAGDATACQMMLMRAGGMTLLEIGQRHGVTKQAVRKRFLGIVGRFPEMEGYLHVENPGVLDMRMSGDRDVMETRTRHYRIMREMTAWMHRA